MTPVRTLLLAAAAIATLALTGCNDPKEDGPVRAPALVTAPFETPSIAELQQLARGFDVGSATSKVIYVFFDPQSTESALLWREALSLPQMHFRWIPVALLNQRSAAQSAALLEARDPVAMLSEQIGVSSGANSKVELKPEMQAALAANSKLLQRLRADRVPYVVGEHYKSTELIEFAGAMHGTSLAQRFGAGGSLSATPEQPPAAMSLATLPAASQPGP